jgi:NAD(P)-dependent dehydrogenase (short-subunit alcohol dehydrogenase family)
VQQLLGDGGLNLLVNNAGVGLVAPAEFVPLDQWRQVLDINLQGPLAVTQVLIHAWICLHFV